MALHEFGHTLGLAHPDESGQSVVALMNSVISDLDHLAADDIAGGRFLYGPRFISETNINGNVGDPLYLPLTTNPPASSISLNYLPPGLSYNSATQVISGTPTWVGESNTALVATTSNGPVSANLHFAIGPPAHAFQTFLDFHYASDYYASQTHTFYTATHNLRVVRDEFNRVVVNVGNGLPRIHFQAEGFQPLQPGVYQGAVASVYGSGGQTALEIIGEGSGCAEGTGAFTVREVTFGARETILSFWATFEQHCTDGLGSHHTGEIRYHVDPDDPLVVPVVSAPASLEINQGGQISFQVSATNGATTYAAFGLPLGVTCSPTGQVSGTPLVAGAFVARLFATNNLGTGETTTAITIHPGPERPHSLLNVSTRGRVGTGDNLMIAGFIITGAEPKTVVLRGLGPSLPVGGALADPFLRLTLPAGVTGIDNWLDVYYPIYYGGWQWVVGTGLAPGHRLEPALVYNLDPGQYTMGLFGVNNATGVAVVEAYDITPYDSSLANISTRGHVGTGDDVLIGGFIIGGNERTNVVVRAIGPTLAQSGVPGPLADPTLELHDGNGASLVQNDDWRTSQEQELISAGLAPTNDRESALLLGLEPGRYTAIVRGKNGGTGVGLVEVYNLDAN